MSGRMWLGTDESYELVLHAQEQVREGIKAGRFSVVADPNSPDFPPIATINGSMAVIDINGPLVDGNAGFMRYFGVVGYDDIAKAALEAYANPDVSKVLWHSNTPGGDVNGVIDMAKMVSQLSALKPSASHTSNLMASAGYWLGSAVQGQLSASPTAEVGSIGVITVHTEYSKQLAADGVTKTVMRSGANKALANPVEPLTEAAKQQTQAKLADVHAMFRAAVATNRPDMTPEDVAAATDGQTFMGKRAVTAGLVDKVLSYVDAVKSLDKANSVPNNPSKSKGPKMKTQLTAEMIAQIQAGATPESLGITIVPDPVAADPAVAAPAVTASVPVTDPVTAPAAPVQAAASDDVVSLLKSQLTTANAQLVATSAKLINLEATTQSQAAAHEGLLKIARDAVSKMHVALGGSAAASETMDASTVIAEHVRVSASFAEKFRVGGVAAPTVADTKASEQDTALTSELLVRLGAQVQSK